jgi:hypothetical protein
MGRDFMEMETHRIHEWGGGLVLRRVKLARTGGHVRRLIVAALLLLAPSALFGAKDYFTNEGNAGITTVTVTLNADPILGANQTVTGQYQTVDGTATAADNDYVPAFNDFIIPAGSGSTTITLQVIGDTKVEADETFTLQLINVNGPIADPGPFIIHIINDDIPKVTVSSPSVKEGNSGTTPLSFVVTLTTPAAVPVQATFSTVDGTATAGDYDPAIGTLVFNPGVTSTVVNVNVNGDTTFEADETFTLKVTPLGGAAASGTGTIINDDAPSVSVAAARVTEGNSGKTPMSFVVTMPAAASVPVEATYRTTDGTATGGVDYELTSGTIVFAPGQTQQTIIVNVLGDTTFEPDETFTLTVTPIGGAAATATGTIVNDDVVPLGGLRIISGAGQGGRLGQTLPQPLVVEVTDVNGATVPGVSIDWKLTKGDGTLNPTSSTTNAQGRASTTLTLGSVGAIEVQASARGLAPVTFTESSATQFEQRVSGPVAVPVAHTLDAICVRNDATFSPACRALSSLDDAQLTAAMERIAPQESGAQARVASEFMSAVTSGIASRLRSLRGGVRRLDIQKISLDFGGRQVPFGMLAMALMPQPTTSAPDEEKDYNGWSGFVSGNLGSGSRRERDGAIGFDLDSNGLMIGVDKQFGDAVIGVSGNLMNYDSTLSHAAGSVDTRGYALSLYGSRSGLFASATPAATTAAHYDGLHLDGSLTLGRNTYHSEHFVDIPGLPPSRALAKNDASLGAVAAGGGLEAHHGKTDFDLTLSATWSRADINHFSESGAGALVLFVDDHTVDSAVGNLGFNVRSVWSAPFGDLLPSFRAELLREIKTPSRFVSARFVRDPDNNVFSVPLDQRDASYGKLSAGLQAVFAHGVSAFVEVTQDVLRSDLRSHSVQVNVSKSF